MERILLIFVTDEKLQKKSGEKGWENGKVRKVSLKIWH